jgi:replicative DNA helicase
VTDKLLPHDFEAEQGVLGAMISEPEAARVVASLLDPLDFYRSAHQAIFAAAVAVVRNGSHPDYLALASELRTRDQLEGIGGCFYLNELTDAVPSAAHVEYYANLVRSCALDRRMRELCFRAAETEETTPPEVRLDLLVTQLRGLMRSSKGEPMPMPKAAEEFFEVYDREAEERKNGNRLIFGANTGIGVLDKVFRGWRPGTLNLVSSMSGAGKTALAVHIAIANAREGKRVAFFSLEMPRRQIVERILANDGKVSLWSITGRNMGEEDYGRAMDVPNHCRTIVIDDSAGLTVEQIHSRVERMTANGQFGLVIVDYLQIVQPALRRDQNREQQVAGIAKGLKDMSKRLDVPVLALSQLNGEGEIRESRGALHVADSETLYDREMDSSDTIQNIKFVVRKNRQGPRKQGPAVWHGDQVRFYDQRKDIA